MKNILLVFSILILLFSCESSHKDKKDLTDLSIQELTTQIKKDSLNINSYKERAFRYYQKHQLDSALQDYEKAIFIDKNDMEALLQLANIYLLKGKSEKSRQTLDECLKLEPNNTDALLKMGQLYYLIEDNIKSFEFLNNLISVNPNKVEAYFYKSMNYSAMGDTAKAISELQKAVAIYPDYFDAYLQLALYSDAIGDTTAAIYYQYAIKIDTMNALAHYDLGIYYQNQKNFDKAFAQYDFILEKIDSNFSTAVYNKAYIYLVYLDSLEKAVVLFDKVTKTDFDYAEAYYNKAYALELLHKYKKAFVEYQTCLKIDPNFILAQEAIARIQDKISL